MSVFEKEARSGAAQALSPNAAKGITSRVAELGGWDRSYPGSALSFGGGWIVAGRSGLIRNVAVGWKSGKRPAWTKTLPGSSQPVEGAEVLFLDGTHETLVALR